MNDYVKAVVFILWVPKFVYFLKGGVINQKSSDKAEKLRPWYLWCLERFRSSKKKIPLTTLLSYWVKRVTCSMSENRLEDELLQHKNGRHNSHLQQRHCPDHDATFQMHLVCWRGICGMTDIGGTIFWQNFDHWHELCSGWINHWFPRGCCSFNRVKDSFAWIQLCDVYLHVKLFIARVLSDKIRHTF